MGGDYVRVMVNLPRETVSELDRIAGAMAVTRSRVTAMAVKQGLSSLIKKLS
jgi:metal-responsive CopG/Arc/MetJ family transcriptional regulator